MGILLATEGVVPNTIIACREEPVGKKPPEETPVPGRGTLGEVIRERLRAVGGTSVPVGDLAPIPAAAVTGASTPFSLSELCSWLPTVGISPASVVVTLNVPVTLGPVTFAEKLRELRLAAGLSQEELATRAQLSAGALKQWESGKRQPQLRAVQKISKALGGDLTLFKDVAFGDEGGD